MGAIGHNSAAFGEELREEIETILGDDHETTFRYAQWHVGDYITGTMGMQLEQEGAYIRFLMRLYQRGKPLPDDDRFMATCMNLSIRVWKRVKDGLIAVGKIIAKAGCLTNARFEKERQLRAETIRKQAEAARQRWAKQRAEKMGLAEVSGKFAGSLDETSPKLSHSTEKNLNEINGSTVTDHMLTNNQYPLTIEEERENAREVAEGTRMQEDWHLPQEWGRWAVHECKRDRDWVLNEAKKFQDYWLSRPDSQGFKKDWKATWRNWCRNALEREAKFNGGRPFGGQRARTWHDDAREANERVDSAMEELRQHQSKLLNGVL